MTFNQLIDTPYGMAHVFGKTSEGRFMVALPKKNMIKLHPDYRGGPCTNFAIDVSKVSATDTNRT